MLLVQLAWHSHSHFCVYALSVRHLCCCRLCHKIIRAVVIARVYHKTSAPRERKEIKLQFLLWWYDKRRALVQFLCCEMILNIPCGNLSQIQTCVVLCVKNNNAYSTNAWAINYGKRRQFTGNMAHTSAPNINLYLRQTLDFLSIIQSVTFIYQTIKCDANCTFQHFFFFSLNLCFTSYIELVVRHCFSVVMINF